MLVRLLQSFTLYIEIITAIVASFYFYKYKNTYLKYFLFLFWYIILNELIGRYIRLNTSLSSSIVYNIYNVVNFIFLLSVYKHFINKQKYKRYIRSFMIIYLISFILNGIFYENYFLESQTIPYVIGSLFLIISIIFYFIEILKSERILLITRLLLFWISIGLLLFHIGYIPYRVIKKYYSIIPTSIGFLLQLFYMLILIMNICFIIGFVKSPKLKE